MAARKQKAKTDNGAGALTVVEGVTLAMVKPGVFNDAYLKALKTKGSSKVKLPPDGTPLAERVAALVLWNRATTPVDQLTGCSACGGDSSITLDMCPFCGDHEIVDAAGNLVEKTLPLGNDEVTEDDPPTDADEAQLPAAPDPTPEPAPSKPQDEPAAVQPQTPKRVKKPRPAAAQEPASPPPVAAPASPPGGRRLRSAGRANIIADHDALDASMQGAMDRDRDPPEPSAAAHETEVVLAPVAGYIEVDLDTKVKQIVALKRDAADSLWKLGQAIKDVLDNRLWMLRVDSNGAPKHRTFKQFVVGELDMSYMQAHRLVQVSEGFTEEEMHKIGVSKCHVMLQVPKDKRAGLLSSAAGGATLTQISNEVAELTANERPKPLPRSAQALTVAMAPGRVELPLFARPKGRHGYASEAEQKANLRPATSITDDPSCVEHLPNDVVVTYNIAKNLDGSWVLIVNRRRATEEELFADEGEEDEEEES